MTSRLKKFVDLDNFLSDCPIRQLGARMKGAKNSLNIRNRHVLRVRTKRVVMQTVERGMETRVTH